MHVVALLPPPLLSSLRAALAGQHTVSAVGSWRALDDRIRGTAVDAAVLDPSIGGDFSVVEIRGILGRFPSAPVVVYTTLTPMALKGIVELARCGVEHVVLYRFDDQPQRLRALLERLPGYALADQMLGRLGEPLRRLPVELARAVERLFRTPARFTDTERFAAEAGLIRRTLYRQLEDAGFASPRLLIQGARVLRAYSYLQDPGCTIKDVSRRLGYGEPRVLARQTLALVGLTPTKLRRGAVSPDEMVSLLAARLWSPPSRSG